MSTAPMVSVVMPAYNAGSYIAEAVRSVLGQTFTDLELVVIDDGSTDETRAILAAITDPRLRYVRHERNRGLVEVLNEGIDLATGRYIARMDADDVMRVDRLEQQVRYLDEHTAIAAVAGFVDVINAEGQVTGAWSTDRATVTESEIRAMMPRTNCIAHPTVMVRRSMLGTLRYDPRMTEGEDWGLWLRMLSDGLRITKIPNVLLSYRQHPLNFTGRARAKTVLERRLLAMRWRFLAGEWSALRFRRYHASVLKGQARTLARHAWSNVTIPLLRSTFRVLTYSPIGLLCEWRAATRTLAQWKGRNMFLLPYLSMGGAEQVHLGVVEAVKDEAALVIFGGFSKDRAFEERFASIGTILEIPRLLNHPWTRDAVLHRIANALRPAYNKTLFGSLSQHFFDLLPLLDPEVRTYYMQHAFLFQPEANQAERKRLRHFSRITGYLFPSRMARDEFGKFLFHQNMPTEAMDKLFVVPCAAPEFGTVRSHDRLGILFVGRDSSEKRAELFLDIVAELQVRAPGRFRYTMAGPKARSGVPHVTFTGPLGDPGALERIYATNDILLLTSEREGHCLVVTEAMAQGLAVIATPVGDVADRVSEATGLLTTTIDRDTVLREMVAGILALDNDRGLLDRTRRNALALVSGRYTREEFRSRYRALLRMPAASA